MATERRRASVIDVTTRERTCASRVAPVRTCHEHLITARASQAIGRVPRMTATTEVPVPRLKTRYQEQIFAALKEQFSYGNPMQVPGLTKIVVNMGVGQAAKDSKLMDGAVRDLSLIHISEPTRRTP